MAFPIIPVIMAATSIAQGIGSNKRAKKQRDEYDAFESQIQERDPDLVSHLEETRRHRRAFMQGTDPISAWTRQQAQNNVAQTQSNLAAMGRGTVSDMLRSQRIGDMAGGMAGAQAMQAGVGLLGQEGVLENSLADQAFNTRWARASRRWSEYAQSNEDSNKQIMAGIGMGAEAMGGWKKTVDPVTTTPTAKAATKSSNSGYTLGDYGRNQQQRSPYGFGVSIGNNYARQYRPGRRPIEYGI